MNFKEFLQENMAMQNLQASIGKQVENQIVQILSQPQYAQMKMAYDRMKSMPNLYQAFLADVSRQSNNTYNLTPAKWLQLIQQHALKAAGTKLPGT